MHTHMHTDAYMHTCTNTHTHTFQSTYLHACILEYTQTDSCTHPHTHTYRHICIQVHTCIGITYTGTLTHAEKRKTDKHPYIARIAYAYTLIYQSLCLLFA